MELEQFFQFYEYTSSADIWFDNLDFEPKTMTYTLWMRDKEQEVYSFEGNTISEAIKNFEDWYQKPLATEEHLDDIRAEMMANTI